MAEDLTQYPSDVLRELADMNIQSPDVTKMYKLKVNSYTMFYFFTKTKRDAFIAKYYKRGNKRFEYQQ
jgi:hypothetical protein